MADLKETIKDKVIRQTEIQTLEGEGNLLQSVITEEGEREGMEEKEQRNSMIPAMVVDMEYAKSRIVELQNFIKVMMVPNIDYGFIPGCPKPMLFKPGAEKLCDIYGLSKQIEVIKRMEDWDKGIFHYEVKATLTNKRTGLVESEGLGSCNNREKKFAGQDPFSVINSILKMAKKRAIVDATLAATRTSGIFGQDMENHVA